MLSSTLNSFTITSPPIVIFLLINARRSSSGLVPSSVAAWCKLRRLVSSEHTTASSAFASIAPSNLMFPRCNTAETTSSTASICSSSSPMTFIAATVSSNAARSSVPASVVTLLCARYANDDADDADDVDDADDAPIFTPGKNSRSRSPSGHPASS